jgi:hypothetical protein
MLDFDERKKDIEPVFGPTGFHDRKAGYISERTSIIKGSGCGV